MAKVPIFPCSSYSFSAFRFFNLKAAVVFLQYAVQIVKGPSTGLQSA